MRSKRKPVGNNRGGLPSGAWMAAILVAWLLFAGCFVPWRTRRLIQNMAAGEASIYISDKVQQTARSASWEGDSAMKTLAPYVILEQGVNGLATQLSLDLDAAAIDAIQFAWHHQQASQWQEEQGYQVNLDWKGGLPYAVGASETAVAMFPFVRRKDLSPTDSLWARQNDALGVPTPMKILAVRVARRKPLCLLAVHSDLCHAAKPYHLYDYLFYDRNGFLTEVVHLVDPCPDGMYFAYLRHTWSRAFQLEQTEIWSASQSEETREVHSDYAKYEWH